MRDTDVLILGAGITGLSCRAALNGTRETLVLEAEDEIGGLLRVHRRGAFVFDTSVHAIFFRDPRLRQLFEELLPAGFRAFTKRNQIWQSGNIIDYPYQFHLRQLPPALRRECSESLPGQVGLGARDGVSFEAWLLEQFGRGLYKHFFEPYNSKLYGVHPSELEAEHMVWTIPSDNHTAILAGAKPEVAAASPSAREHSRSGGGTPSAPPNEPRNGGGLRSNGGRCLYPRGAEGVAAVAHAMAARGSGAILCGERIAHVDPRRRRVTTTNGLCVRYRELVSTLPLPALIGKCIHMSDGLRASALSLTAAPVTVVQVGVREQSGVLPGHWTYFPDADIPFYRMTRLERISPDLCPRDASALLLECPGRSQPDRHQVLGSLVRLGVISSPDVTWYGTRCIPHAYVLFRPGDAEAVNTLRRALQVDGIRSVGRYGAWRYANIEQCVVSGLGAAQEMSPADSQNALLVQLNSLVAS